MAAQGKRPPGAETIHPSKRRRVEQAEQCQQMSHKEGQPVPSSDQRPIVDFASVADTVSTGRSVSKRPKIYLCNFADCSKAFDRPVRLQAHQRTHTNDRPFVCHEQDCDKAFFKAEHLKAHFQNKHGEDASYICTYVVNIGEDGEQFECGKAFTTATRLRRHVAAHEQKEELKCQEIGCGLVFRKLETLQRHIKKDHLREKAFKCKHLVLEEITGIPDECGCEFATVGQLKAHENREHAGLRHFCELCSPAGNKGSSLDEGESDFSEALPRVGFVTYAELQAHVKAQHPPTCDVCGLACESRRALTAHKDIEHSSLSERQKYPCTHAGCGRSFTRQGNLKVHIQNVHVKHKKFVCGHFDLHNNDKCPGWDGHGCGMAFGTKANLENHTRTQHLQLPSLLKRAVKIKNEEDSNLSFSPMEIDEPLEPEVLSGTGDERRAVALLTGYGYSDARPLACWMQDCPVRFTRPYDLAQHMELKHGWLVDDINDRFAEDEALSGGQFWIGGDGNFDDDDSQKLTRDDTHDYDTMYDMLSRAVGRNQSNEDIQHTQQSAQLTTTTPIRAMQKSQMWSSDGEGHQRADAFVSGIVALDPELHTVERTI